MKIIAIVLSALIAAHGTDCLCPCETCLLEPIGPELGLPSTVLVSPYLSTSCNCQCSIPQCSSYREIACPCNSCPPKPKCACSCLDPCGCSCEALKAAFSFPDVEYPVTAMEVKPAYYGCCWTC